MCVFCHPLLGAESPYDQGLPEIALVLGTACVDPLFFVPACIPSTSMGACHLLCSASISRASPLANLVKFELPVEGVGTRSALFEFELTTWACNWTLRGRGVGSPSPASTCTTRREEGRAVTGCDCGGCRDKGWPEVDVTLRADSCRRTGVAARGRNAGERGLLGENVRCDKASESFGFDVVGSGVSGSDDDEDVDRSE